MTRIALAAPAIFRFVSVSWPNKCGQPGVERKPGSPIKVAAQAGFPASRRSPRIDDRQTGTFAPNWTSEPTEYGPAKLAPTGFAHAMKAVRRCQATVRK